MENYENSSSLTKSNSTADIYKESSAQVGPSSVHVFQNEVDLNKLSLLIEKEKKVLAEEKSQSNSKMTFSELKNNVQMILHNLDNFFIVVPDKKKKKIQQKEEDIEGIGNNDMIDI
jgi:hypothetical protein